MNDLTSNDYNIAAASLEIIVLMLGAFVLGAMLCYVLRLLGLCCRKQKLVVSTAREALINSQASIPASTPEVRSRSNPITPAAETIPSSGSMLRGDTTVYGADINSLLRSNSDDTGISVERGTASSSSFESRAKESLASLRRENDALPAAIDYTLDMPKPDDNQMDDLQKLEGIDARIEKLLNEADIKSYAKLATMDRDYLKKLLEQGGKEFTTSEPKSWPYQAELAAKENWSRLKEYQAFLLDGRS